MPIVNTRLLECLRKCVAIELWVMARARNGSYIEEARHAVNVQELEEALDRPRGMPNCEDGSGLLSGRPIHRNHPASSRRSSNKWKYRSPAYGFLFFRVRATFA